MDPVLPPRGDAHTHTDKEENKETKDRCLKGRSSCLLPADGSIKTARERECARDRESERESERER